MTLNLFSIPLALMTLGPSGTTGSPNVAVVNVAVVSEKYVRTAELEQRFEEMRNRFREERDALQQRMELAARSLQEELKPGTDAYDARRRELAMLEAELKFFVESKGREIEAGLANSLRLIYSDIQAGVREIAELRGIEVVLAGDEISENGPDSPNQARQQILLQKVVYWNPRVDLTADVIALMNAKRAGSSNAIAQPTPAPGSGNGSE